MSSWGMGWFGGGTPAATKKKDAPKNAILGLRSTLDMLNKREVHLQNQIDVQDGLARKNISTNKTAAKAALRRKKQHEHNLEQNAAQMMSVEREIMNIESANINRETMEAMRNAGAALKQIHGSLTVDKVDQAMEDLREQHEISTEIGEALTQGAYANAGDEDELEAELEELQQEELDNKMLKSGAVPQDQLQRLPTPAGGELRGKTARVEEDEEDEELRKLQAEMAM